jgi:hypothetical protein
MPLSWIAEQTRGTARNVWSTLTGLELGQVFPPFVVDILLFTRDTVPRGLGFASRAGHIGGVISLTLVLIIASLATLTYVAVAYFVIAFPIALLRLIPAVDKRWPLSADNWPLWEVSTLGFDGGRGP